MNNELANEGLIPEACFIFGPGRTCLFTDEQLLNFRNKNKIKKLLIRFIDADIALLTGLLSNCNFISDDKVRINVKDNKNYFMSLTKILVDKCHIDLSLTKIGKDYIIDIIGLNFWINLLLNIKLTTERRWIPEFITTGNLEEQINYIYGFMVNSYSDYAFINNNSITMFQLGKMLNNLGLEIEIDSDKKINIISKEAFDRLFINKDWKDSKANSIAARSAIAILKSKKNEA